MLLLLLVVRMPAGSIKLPLTWIGLYYFENSPFSVAAVQVVAESFSNEAEPIVTDFHEWGAWVNGGAWIHTAHGKVEIYPPRLKHSIIQNSLWSSSVSRQYDSSIGHYSQRSRTALAQYCKPSWGGVQTPIQAIIYIEATQSAKVWMYSTALALNYRTSENAHYE